jgi:hypothetical protein
MTEHRCERCGVLRTDPRDLPGGVCWNSRRCRERAVVSHASSKTLRELRGAFAKCDETQTWRAPEIVEAITAVIRSEK